MKVILRKKVQNKTHNKALQLTSNTPLRSVLRSTELKRYVKEIIYDSFARDLVLHKETHD